MPLPDLLLRTRRLRREIDAQSQQLEHDIKRVKLASTHLRHTAVARATSPLALLSAVGAGFLVGKIGGRPQPKQFTKKTMNKIAALTLETARAIGIQVVLPMVVEWVQLKLTHSSSSNPSDKNEDPIEPHTKNQNN